MTAELTPQQFRQVYREAEPRAEHAKFLNPLAHAADAAWRALVANLDRPPIPTDAAVPVNAIVGRLAPEEIFVAMAPGKQFANPVAHLLGVDELQPFANSAHRSIAPGPAGPVNAIGSLLERPGETT
jgi:hypothetical protein